MNLGLKHKDGRRLVDGLYRSFSTLEAKGWVREEIAVSARVFEGGLQALPILSYRSPKKGPALWIISGIHGEEPAGPNAIAEGIDCIAELGRDYPVVLLPLCNPLGYANNWRYTNMQKWTEGGGEHSVGDADHVMPDLKNPAVPRRLTAACPESDALIAHVLRLVKDYPPFLSVDLHEDDQLDGGYIYSQGRYGVKDPIARKMATILSAGGIAIKMDGLTRFHEKIVKGIVTAEGDGSIDELLAAEKIIVNGRAVDGPRAESVIVVETPAGEMHLATRISAHLAILRNLNWLLDETHTMEMKEAARG